ncbi:MAG: ABC transporter permease [Ktedonobacteraceae bacterium]
MYYIRMLALFLRVSVQEEMAYRANFFISLLQSSLDLSVGVLSIVVLFSQVNTIHGWNFAATLALLGTYLMISAIRAIVIGPSFESLVGLDGEIWTGRFDFTLLRPVPVQFLASFRRWRVLPTIDLLLGIGVLVVAITKLSHTLTFAHVLTFLIALLAGILILYAILLCFASCVFWSPGFLFTWVFDGIFQMARYPLGLYPGWARLILTWIIPVGVMTTVPAQALTGGIPAITLAGTVVIASVLVIGASFLFQTGLRRYASASS